MVSAEKEGNREDVASDVAAVIGLLRRLVRGRRLDRGLEGIHVRISEQDDAIACEVQIKGDDKASRDKIKTKFPAKEGWTCTDTGETTATCHSP